MRSQDTQEVKQAPGQGRLALPLGLSALEMQTREHPSRGVRDRAPEPRRPGHFRITPRPEDEILESVISTGATPINDIRWIRGRG